MRISKSPNATPQSTPPSSAGSQRGADAAVGDEQFIWRSLVSRLVHPARLQIVEALIEKDGPMTVEELTPLVPASGDNTDLVRYHAKAMIEAGVLEVVAADQAQAEGEEETPSLFFSLPR